MRVRQSVAVLQAQEETEEAIKEGNHRYNSMLNDRMNKEDQLRRSIESLKLEVATKDSKAKSLQDDIAKTEADAAAAQARQHKSWEVERRAAAAQQEQVGARSQQSSIRHADNTTPCSLHKSRISHAAT